MGREVRRVPKDWGHPRDKDGHYIPQFDGKKYQKDRKAFLAEVKKDGYEAAVKNWGLEPTTDQYMPTWPKEHATHFQLYENTSEGTPLSPPKSSQESLAQWITDNFPSVDSYEDNLQMVKVTWAPDGLANHKSARLMEARVQSPLDGDFERDLHPSDITADNYHHYATRTEPLDHYDECHERIGLYMRLLHAALGMVTEAGEFADDIKKHTFYGKKLDPAHLEEEMGDMLWYIAVAADALGIDIGKLMYDNIVKLKKRFPDQFTKEHALARKDEDASIE